MSDVSPQVPRIQHTGCLSGLARVTWFMFGNFAIALLAVFIAEREGLSVLDIAYWATVALLIVIRYLDITRLGGLTADGEPATLRHWRAYVVRLFLISAPIWVVAHIL